MSIGCESVRAKNWKAHFMRCSTASQHGAFVIGSCGQRYRRRYGQRYRWRYIQRCRQRHSWRYRQRYRRSYGQKYGQWYRWGYGHRYRRRYIQRCRQMYSRSTDRDTDTALLRSPHANFYKTKQVWWSTIKYNACTTSSDFQLETPASQVFLSGQTLVLSLVQAVRLDYIEVWYVGLYNSGRE